MVEQPSITLTMIVKNEEANLPRVLASVRSIADELVVVDTGSTDRTVEVARAHGARVFHFAWCDDFAAARNFALDQATGRWVLWLDGDDLLLESAPGALRAELAGLDERVQFVRVPVRSPSHDGAGYTVFGSRRLFRNVPEIRWHRPIHEMLFHSTLEGQPEVEVGGASAMVDHLGNADAEHRASERKGQRNMRIIRREIARDPESPHWHYYLALQHASAGQHPTALKVVKRALRRFAGSVRPDFEGALRCLGMRAAMHMGRPEVAVQLGLPIVKVYAYSELCYTLGLAYCALRDWPQAERFLRLATSLRGRVAEFQTDAGTGSWKAMIQLGTVAWEMGNAGLALERWRSAFEWAPDQPLVNLALGRGLMTRGAFDEAVGYLQRAVDLAPGLAEAQASLAAARELAGGGLRIVHAS